MDNLSAKFLKVHKKTVYKNYALFGVYNQPRKVTKRWDGIEIKVDELSDANLQKWFILFQEYLKKESRVQEFNILETYKYDFDKFRDIVCQSETLVEYAQKINSSRFVLGIKDKIITNAVISFSKNHLAKINSLEKGEVKKTKKVFIGTEYSNKYDNAKEIIKKVIQNSNLKSVVLNEKEHNEIIDNELYKEMDNCDFGIFDISANNCNVAFEAGYMLGKGKEIILICDDNCFKEIKFDFNHRNMVLFKSDEELKEKLEKRLYSVITKIYI